MVLCIMLACACIPIGLDDAASVRIVALPAAVGALPLVESTTQPGAATQRISTLPALRLPRLGLGASSRGRLALGLRLCTTRRLCLPDLRRGQLPHRFARLQSVLDDLTQRFCGVPEAVYPDRPLCFILAPDPAQRHVVLERTSAILPSIVIAHKHIQWALHDPRAVHCLWLGRRRIRAKLAACFAVRYQQGQEVGHIVVERRCGVTIHEHHLEAFSHSIAFAHIPLLMCLRPDFEHHLCTERTLFELSGNSRDQSIGRGISGSQVILYLAQRRASMSSNTGAASRSSISMVS